MNGLQSVDPEIYNVLQKELERGRNGLEMIASENYVSKAILQATGSILTNKYSEGYPKRRYYGGNEFIDLAEQLAIDRGKELFGADFANVQPHSGTSANMEAYHSLLELGDKILSMSLNHGGHLSHGHKVNFSGKHYKIDSYMVNKENHRLDMESVRLKAKEVKPKLIVAGFSAYSRELDFKHFREIAEEVDAFLLSDIAHIAGLVATKEHPDPVPYSDIVTTTTHKTLRGPRGAVIFGKQEFENSVNRAVFPGMQGGPFEHVIAAKAVAFKEAMSSEFKQYIKNVKKNSKTLAESLLENDVELLTGGTDNHLLVIIITKYGIGGKLAEKTLDKVGIFTNKNVIPYDSRSPFDPSGIRVGTAALTTRGLTISEMEVVGELIAKTLKNHNNTSALSSIKSSVQEICNSYPLYQDL